MPCNAWARRYWRDSSECVGVRPAPRGNEGSAGDLRVRNGSDCHSTGKLVLVVARYVTMYSGSRLPYDSGAVPRFRSSRTPFAGEFVTESIDMRQLGGARRRGFTMIEALIVVTTIGIMVMLVGPKIGELSARSALRASRQALASAFAAARTSAFQKGKTATLTLAGNQATVTVLNGLYGNSITVYGPVRLDSELKTTLTPLNSAPTSIYYDARGLVTPVPIGVNKYLLTRGNYSDTLCLSAAGIILPRSCQL